MVGLSDAKPMPVPLQKFDRFRKELAPSYRDCFTESLP
jgi:hypothetical protein